MSYLNKEFELLRFPSQEFRSLAEFRQYRQEFRDQFDTRYRHELSLASSDDHVLLNGTCGPCLKSTQFISATADGEELPDGRRVPHWREQLLCACEARLNNRERAVLHLINAKLGAGRWSGILTFGPPEAVARHLPSTSENVLECHRLPASRSDRAFRLPEADQSRDMVISIDYLDRVPALADIFAEIARILRPGGAFVFTVSFFAESALTISNVQNLRKGNLLPAEAPHRVHNIGWDILPMLCAQGFEDAWADFYWSKEFGYLGTANPIFVATKRHAS